jgi:glycine cleavage system H protein
VSPDDRQYTKEHEWIIVEDADSGRALVGITEYAQDQLGDVVYFDLPKAGDNVQHMAKMGEVESVKAVSDLYSPVTGQVIEINTDLIDHPELVNEDPYNKGWIMRITISNSSELDRELDSLMSSAEYESYISGL